jgi:hypothetical protein
LAIAVENAHQLGGTRSFSRPINITLICQNTDGALNRAKDDLSSRETNPPKKRKICNAIGKIIQGSLAISGNILAASTANPLGWAIAIPSAAVGIGLFWAGAGDIRGE